MTFMLMFSLVHLVLGVLVGLPLAGVAAGPAVKGRDDARVAAVAGREGPAQGAPDRDARAQGARCLAGGPPLHGGGLHGHGRHGGREEGLEHALLGWVVVGGPLGQHGLGLEFLDGDRAGEQALADGEVAGGLADRVAVRRSSRKLFLKEGEIVRK